MLMRLEFNILDIPSIMTSAARHEIYAKIINKRCKFFTPEDYEEFVEIQFEDPRPMAFENLKRLATEIFGKNYTWIDSCIG